MQKISSKTHGIIDFATCGMMILLPRLLGCSKSCRRVLDTAAVTVLGQSLCTNYEFGLARVIPFKMHLMLDQGLGAGLIGCASFNDHLDSEDQLLVAGFGAINFTAATITEQFSETEMREHIGLGEVTPANRIREELEAVSGMI